MLGEACLLNGEVAKAKLVLGVALEASTNAGFLLGIGLSKHVIGRIASAEGDREAAARNLGEAIDIFARIGAHFELARARMERARLWRAGGDGAETARTDVREARQAFAALGMPIYVERIEQLGEHLGIP